MRHGEYVDETDRRTDARPLHYAFNLSLDKRICSIMCILFLLAARTSMSSTIIGR